MNGIRRLAIVSAIAAAAIGLAACDEGYAYGGPAVGYGPAGYDAYYDGYAEPYYGYPGYGAGYYGWYGGYYYPGTGFYVYDRYRRPLRWNGDQRRYWQGQRNGYSGTPGVTPQGFTRNPNWGGFDRSAGTRAAPAGQAFRGGAAPTDRHGFGGGPGRSRRHR